MKESVNVSKVKIHTDFVDEDYKEDIPLAIKQVQSIMSTWGKEFKLNFPSVKITTENITIKNVSGDINLDQDCELDSDNYSLEFELSNGDKLHVTNSNLIINNEKISTDEITIDGIQDLFEAYVEWKNEKLQRIIDTLEHFL